MPPQCNCGRLSSGCGRILHAKLFKQNANTTLCMQPETTIISPARSGLRLYASISTIHTPCSHIGPPLFVALTPQTWHTNMLNGCSPTPQHCECTHIAMPGTGVSETSSDKATPQQTSSYVCKMQTHAAHTAYMALPQTHNG